MARLFEIIQLLDANGNALAGGKVHTFDGGTSTPKAAFTDSTAGTPHANPVILDSAGRAQIWLDGTPYKLRIDDSADVTIITLDNVSGTSALGSIRTQASTTLTCTNGALILTATGLVPANARLANVFVENTVAPGTSNGLTGYHVGSHGVDSRWAANFGLTLGLKSSIGNFQLSEQPLSSSSQDVNIIALGGTFDGVGSIAVTIEYETGTAP